MSVAVVPLRCAVDAWKSWSCCCAASKACTATSSQPNSGAHGGSGQTALRLCAHDACCFVESSSAAAGGATRRRRKRAERRLSWAAAETSWPLQPCPSNTNRARTSPAHNTARLSWFGPLPDFCPRRHTAPTPRNNGELCAASSGTVPAPRAPFPPQLHVSLASLRGRSGSEFAMLRSSSAHGVPGGSASSIDGGGGGEEAPASDGASEEEVEAGNWWDHAGRRHLER
mmetsp:Transcript_11306/g.28386  ORF Transcript_11306/g.28386 Transcript_11306/m.28386 type:complete len:228 (+) Transcript_11306:739-1422(+)